MPCCGHFSLRQMPFPMTKTKPVLSGVASAGGLRGLCVTAQGPPALRHRPFCTAARRQMEGRAGRQGAAPARAASLPPWLTGPLLRGASARPEPLHTAGHGAHSRVWEWAGVSMSASTKPLSFVHAYKIFSALEKPVPVQLAQRAKYSWAWSPLLASASQHRE